MAIFALTFAVGRHGRINILKEIVIASSHTLTCYHTMCDHCAISGGRYRRTWTERPHFGSPVRMRGIILIPVSVIRTYENKLMTHTNETQTDQRIWIARPDVARCCVGTPVADILHSSFRIRKKYALSNKTVCARCGVRVELTKQTRTAHRPFNWFEAFCLSGWMNMLMMMMIIMMVCVSSLCPSSEPQISCKRHRGVFSIETDSDERRLVVVDDHKPMSSIVTDSKIRTHP